MNSNWYVYIVRCSDDTLYTGIATDLERRVSEHNSVTGGAKYTRSRQPVKLVYSEQVVSRSVAASREYQIKHLSTVKKRALTGA